MLGPVEVLKDDRQLSLGGPRQRALLALLLLRANHVVSSDVLLDELWRGEPPLAGRAALRVRVSQLRKALGAEAIITRAPGYMLVAASEDLDLHSFEALVEGAREADPTEAARLLREALALWRGPALNDVAYESFARPEIARLEELRLVALELRIDADLSLGEHSRLVPELESAVARNPLRERLRGQLMLALYRSGRQADALEVFQQGRRALRDELGLEPGRTLRELEAAILRQDPALDPPASEPAIPDRALLLAIRDESRADVLASVGAALAKRPPRELIVARLIEPSGDLAAATAVVRGRVELLREEGVAARAAVFTSSQVSADLTRLATEQDVDLLVLDARPDELEAAFSEILASAPCDVGLLVSDDTTWKADAIAVPFGGAEHDWAAVEVGAWLAKSSGSSLILIGTVAGKRRDRDSSRLLASASLIVQRVTGVVPEPRLAEPGAAGVAATAPQAGLLVVGLSTRWRREGIGRDRIELARAVGPVLFIRKGIRPGGLAPPESVTRFTWTLTSSVRGG